MTTPDQSLAEPGFSPDAGSAASGRSREPTASGSDALCDGSIVSLVDVHKSFGRLSVLRGVSLEIPRGKVTVVLGPSGCGKSVMLKLIVGLLTPDRGEIRFDGARIDRLSESRLVSVRRQIGFLFQQSALFDSMSVEANVAFPLVEHTELSKRERHQRVLEVLAMVGLADTGQKMPAELSGGQRKRVGLARAIVLQPRLILYDEPTTGLDPIRSDVINELILRLQKTLGASSIVVTHDLGSAFKVADRMVMLHDGGVALEGPPAEFRASEDPIVRGFLRGEAGVDDLAAINGTPQRHSP